MDRIDAPKKKEWLTVIGFALRTISEFRCGRVGRTANMGGAYSRTFSADVRDTLLAGTYGFNHGHLQCTVDRLVGRLTVMVICYASWHGFAWDSGSKQVRLARDGQHNEQVWNRLIKVCDERIPPSEMWDMNRRLNALLKKVHSRAYNEIFNEYYSAGDGSGDIDDKDKDNEKDKDKDKNVGSSSIIPPSALETWVHVSVLTAREAVEMFLLDAQAVFVGRVQALSAGSSRAGLMALLLPHMNREAKAMACAAFCEVLYDELVKQAKAIIALEQEDDSSDKVGLKHRKFNGPAEVMARCMVMTLRKVDGKSISAKASSIAIPDRAQVSARLQQVTAAHVGLAYEQRTLAHAGAQDLAVRIAQNTRPLLDMDQDDEDDEDDVQPASRVERQATVKTS